MVFNNSVFAYTAYVCSCAVFLNWVISSTPNTVTTCSWLFGLVIAASTACCFLLVSLCVFVQFCAFWSLCYSLYVTYSHSWKETDCQCFKIQCGADICWASCQCISSYGHKKWDKGVLEHLRITCELHVLSKLQFPSYNVDF